MNDVLPHFYSNFQKDFIASLTVKLASGKLFIPGPIRLHTFIFCVLFIFNSLRLQVANVIAIVQKIFEDAGFVLAHHLMAIYPKVDKV